MRSSRAGNPHFPLSAAQHGVWVAQQMDPTNPRYNCGGYLEIHGTVDIPLFEQAVRKAVAETEALRIRFVADSDGPWQVIEPLTECPWHVIDVSDDQDPQQTAETWMRADLAKPVDLGTAPLFNHALFKVAADRSFFYLRYHQIAVDRLWRLLY